MELISDKNENKPVKISNKYKNQLNSNNFDFLEVIEKSQNNSKKIEKKLINSDPSSEKASKKYEKNEDNIKMKTETINSLFSFGDTQNNIIEINQNSRKYQQKENNDTYSFNYQDSSMVNSSKSLENDSNKIINSKSNEIFLTKKKTH